MGTTTLSDLVVEIEYVDANGVKQTINDPAELLAASGAFGLLGVVVSLTLQIDDMGLVNMMPVKLPMPLAIPPPKGYPLPQEVEDLIERLVRPLLVRIVEPGAVDGATRVVDHIGQLVRRQEAVLVFGHAEQSNTTEALI